MTDVRGPKTGPLTAVFRASEPPRVPEQPSPVVSLGSRTRPPDPAEAERVRVHQAFLGRVVDYLCADAGIRQFVDWGCPVPGTAERVRRASADATLVHLAPTGTAGVLAAPARNATVLAGDGSGDSGTDAVLRRLHTSGLVDFDEPVAVLMTRPGTEQDPPAGLDTLHGMMRGGGYVALTSTAPRPTAERAFAPFLPVEPGVADLTWWPYPDEDVSAPGCGTLGGLGRVPRRGRGATRWR